MKINYKKINLALRELYRLIIVFDRDTKECQYLDYDREVMNLPYEPNDFECFCYVLRENIHPVDREEFLSFSDLELLVCALDEKPFVSIECRLKLYDRHYYWSEIVFCRVNGFDESNNQFLLLHQMPILLNLYKQVLLLKRH